MNQTLPFPYGTFPVESTVRTYYEGTELSDDHPLPHDLPLHHPVLQHLEGVYTTQDMVPPWWVSFVDQVHPRVRPLLADLSISEFRAGCIDEHRWCEWRNTCSQEERKAEWFLRSPRLASLLEGTIWQGCFIDRGGKDTPASVDLVISCHPEYLLNMSSGQGWTSCQHLYWGEENEYLPGNLYDVGVAVAMLMPTGADIWEGSDLNKEGVVIARTTLRILFHPQDGQVYVVLGRTYSNNSTSELLLISKLIELLEQHKLCWGLMSYYGMRRLMASGKMGKRWADATIESVKMVSPAFLIPSSWRSPYVDGDGSFYRDIPSPSILDWEWDEFRGTILVYTPSSEHA